MCIVSNFSLLTEIISNVEKQEIFQEIVCLDVSKACQDTYVPPKHCMKSVQRRSFYLPVFSCIWTEYRPEKLRIAPFSRSENY